MTIAQDYNKARTAKDGKLTLKQFAKRFPTAYKQACDIIDGDPLDGPCLPDDIRISNGLLMYHVDEGQYGSGCPFFVLVRRGRSFDWVESCEVGDALLGF